MFAIPITLTFKGDDAIKSSCRGIVSVIVMFIVYMSLPIMLGKELNDPEYEQDQLTTYLTKDSTGYQFGTANSTVAIQLMAPSN